MVLDAKTWTEIGRATFVTESPVPKCLHGWYAESNMKMCWRINDIIERHTHFFFFSFKINKIRLLILALQIDIDFYIENIIDVGKAPHPTQIHPIVVKVIYFRYNS